MSESRLCFIICCVLPMPVWKAPRLTCPKSTNRLVMDDIARNSGE